MRLALGGGVWYALAIILLTYPSSHVIVMVTEADAPSSSPSGLLTAETFPVTGPVSTEPSLLNLNMRFPVMAP